MTIKETSFFRDRPQLDAIAWRALLEHAQAAGSQEIRVWCAACATGEEAYTLALLACEAFGPAVPPVRILATDISNAALDAVRTGRYRERSLRKVAPTCGSSTSSTTDGQLRVGDRLRSLVHAGAAQPRRPGMPPLGERRST